MEIFVAVVSKIFVFFMLLAVLNLVVGKLNMWAFGYVGFFGMGSFLAIFLQRLWQIGPWLSLVITLLGGLLIAVLFSWLSLKLGESPFLVLNLFWVQLVYSLVVNYGGPDGLQGFQRPAGLAGILASPTGFLLGLLLPASLILVWIIFHYTRSPIHRWAYFVSTCPREAELAGYDVTSLRTVFFLVGAFWALLSGVLYAWLLGGTDPNVVTPYWGLLIFALVLVGGVDSLRGSLVAALLLTVLPLVLAKLFAFSPKASFYSGQVSQLIFGLLIITMVRYFPQGIAGRRLTWSKEGY